MQQRLTFVESALKFCLCGAAITATAHPGQLVSPHSEHLFSKQKEASMVNTPEQFIQAQKLTFDLFQAVALKSLEGFEKLAELNAPGREGVVRRVAPSS
jgi:hypothetical protein